MSDTEEKVSKSFDTEQFRNFAARVVEKQAQAVEFVSALAEGYDAASMLLAYLVARQENGEFKFRSGQFDDASYELEVVHKGNDIIYRARFHEAG